MKKPKDIIISKFDNFRMPKNITSISLFDELRNIKNGQYKTTIINCRKAYDKGNIEEYNTFKTSLPSVTFSGVFNNTRKSTNILLYNNILVIDVDKLSLEELNKTKENLKSDEYVLSVWISPSGRGLKALIKVEGTPQDHKFLFLQIAGYFKSKFDIEIDKSGSDITRLCFTSWDKDIHYNPEAKIFEAKKIPTVSPKRVIYNFTIPQPIKSDNKRNINITEDILAYLEKRKTSITTNYLDWRNVALAISNTFNEKIGVDYFLRFCRLDGKSHDEEHSLRLIKSIYQNTRTSSAKITLKTITYLATQKGYKKSLKSLL